MLSIVEAIHECAGNCLDGSRPRGILAGEVNCLHPPVSGERGASDREIMVFGVLVTELVQPAKRGEKLRFSAAFPLDGPVVLSEWVVFAAARCEIVSFR